MLCNKHYELKPCFYIQSCMKSKLKHESPIIAIYNSFDTQGYSSNLNHPTSTSYSPPLLSCTQLNLTAGQIRLRLSRTINTPCLQYSISRTPSEDDSTFKAYCISENKGPCQSRPSNKVIFDQTREILHAFVFWLVRYCPTVFVVISVDFPFCHGVDSYSPYRA